MSVRLFFLGLAGSGKDTIRIKLESKLFKEGLISVDIGTVLRERAQTDENIKDVQAAGGIVSSDKVLDLFEELLLKEDFLISGSPRRPEEASWIVRHDNWKKNPGYLVYLNISEQAATERLLKRGRYDDQVDVIKNRIELFNKVTIESINIFRQENRLIEIYADGLSPDEVCDQIIQELKKRENV